MKLPHFFKYAKDKEDHQVTELNTSTVNKLEYIIPNKPIRFKNVVGHANHKNLLSNETIIRNIEVLNKFISINRRKRFIMNNEVSTDVGFNLLLVNELSKIESDVNIIVDTLVDYLYHIDSRYKESLWSCYGEILYTNLTKNLGNSIQCETCTARFEQKTSKEVYCHSCKKERIKATNRNRKK